jgi:hypothetical protein
MKSIKEFATEYAQDKYLPVQTSQAVKAGANYVLENIEGILDADIGGYKSQLDRIKNFIEQLKR